MRRCSPNEVPQGKWKLQILQHKRERTEKREGGRSGETASLSWSISRREKFNLPGCPSGRGWVSMLLNTLKGFAASPSSPSRAIAGKVSAWCLWMSERVPFPQHPSPLSLCYSYAALGNWSWNLFTNCLDFAWFVPWVVSFESWFLSLESWVLRVARVAACAEVHTRPNTRKDMRAVKRSIRQWQLERQHCQRLARNFKFPGEFLQPELKEIVYACSWHVCVCTCVCVVETI